MKKNDKRMWVLGMAALLLLGGCLETWAQLKTSPALGQGWQNRALNPELNYYYCGRSGLPYAVAGIDKAWTFDSRFWFKIESMDEVYDKIDRLSNLEPGQNTRYAREILAPDGRLIGTYFSYYHSTPVQVDYGTKTVVVYNPYQPDDPRSNDN